MKWCRIGKFFCMLVFIVYKVYVVWSVSFLSILFVFVDIVICGKRKWRRSLWYRGGRRKVKVGNVGKCCWIRKRDVEEKWRC